MIRIRILPAVVLALSASLTLDNSQLAIAQTAQDSTQTASVPMGASTATAKQTSKAQRKAALKAERKAARQKRNADLSALEKNGYRMSGGNQTDYPDNLQNAERKAAASKTAAGASSPGQ
jgi:hypothetical protein